MAYFGEAISDQLRAPPHFPSPNSSRLKAMALEDTNLERGFFTVGSPSPFSYLKTTWLSFAKKMGKGPGDGQEGKFSAISFQRSAKGEPPRRQVRQHSTNKAWRSPRLGG